MAWAHPTAGVIPPCAPSLARVLFSSIQGLREMLAHGYVVAATDYPVWGRRGRILHLRMSLDENRPVSLDDAAVRDGMTDLQPCRRGRYHAARQSDGRGGPTSFGGTNAIGEARCNEPCASNAENFHFLNDCRQVRRC